MQNSLDGASLSENGLNFGDIQLKLRFVLTWYHSLISPSLSGSEVIGCLCQDVAYLRSQHYQSKIIRGTNYYRLVWATLKSIASSAILDL
jgi:hypothetical protein